MPTAPTRVVFDLGDKVRVSPPIWPDHKLNIQPGDLTKSVPYGNGVYGYQDRKGSNPFTSAPSQEACGGVIYFGNGVSKADFEALMRIMEVQPAYVVKPSKDMIRPLGQVAVHYANDSAGIQKAVPRPESFGFSGPVS